MALSNGGAIQLLKKSMNYNNFLSWQRFASFISLFILIMGVVSPLQSFAKDESFQELLNQLSTKDFQKNLTLLKRLR